MIAEVLIVGFTVSFVSSLGFTFAFLKKQREWDMEDSKPEPEPDPGPVIFPFVQVIVGTPCPKCLQPSKNEVTEIDKYGHIRVVSKAEGLSFSRSCAYLHGENYAVNTCVARKLPHLHVSCNSCGYKWFMAPADSAKSKPNTQAEPVETIAIL